MHANKRDEIEEVLAGDIAAAMGLKDTRTGNTLSDHDKPIILESITFPEPVIDVAIEPKTKADQEKMGIALQRLAEEDPTFRVRTDQETSQTILAGMGELHLEILVERMKREFKVEANVGRPQVAFRETIKKRAKAEGKFMRQSVAGSVRPCGHPISPTEPGEGSTWRTRSSAVPYPASSSSQLRKAMKEAFKMVSRPDSRWWMLRLSSYDRFVPRGRLHEMAFKIAGSMALPGGCAPGQADYSRAHHESRSRCR